MKEKKDVTERSIGDVINELSAERASFTLERNGKSYEVFFHPPGQSIMTGYANLAKNEGTEADAMLSYFASNCVKDADGKKVWRTPADVDVRGVILIRLRNIIYKEVMDFNLSEFALKN